MLLTIAVLLLLPGCGGHAIQIVPLAVSGKQPVPGGGVHNSRSTNRRNVLQDVHEELQGGELHRHRWLSGGPEWTLIYNLIDYMFDFKFKLNFHILKLSFFGRFG